MSDIVEGLPFTDEKKQYIINVLDPLLEEMITDILTEMPGGPGQPQDFMIKWLAKRCGRGVTNKRSSLQAMNQQLKAELDHAQSVMAEIGATSAVAPEPAKDEDEEEEDDDCGDEIPESFRQSEAQGARARTSVSAEAYGQWNQKKAFTPPVYPKTDDQLTRLGSTLSKSFMFAALEKAEMDILLQAMKECNFAAGTQVITEGENGDYLFVIEKGALDCIKRIGEEDKVVKTVNEGDVFGELALLYNCARAANVIAKDACVCWQLDRDTFNNIVKDAAVKRREKYDAFFKSVTLLQSMNAYERSQIADALKAEVFGKGHTVIAQDEPGDKFYLVEEGALYASKETPTGQQKVMDYAPGDYFGELALLNNQPRAASVIVSSETAKVLSLSRLQFNKMLGPLQGLLSRQVSEYK
mmetsp:Transcript_149972/g.276709  ORF Transcript_149972/g.276709 Transcript_149972/m.276709 type:complete len:412 (-) Transcript_149972:133-1368(-)